MRALHSILLFGWACLGLSAPFPSPPSPITLGTDLTILINDDVLGQQSPSADSAVILLDPITASSAASVCAALGENLWSPELQTSSIQPNLDYITYEKKYPKNQRYWIAPSGNQQRAIDGSGNVASVNGNPKLPALCTQSAPFSIPTANTSARWQVTVETNNQYITGYRDRLSFRFFNIRYAPLPLRFTYSTLYNGHGEQYSALQPGPQCVQSSGGSEDCLFLNVWTPYLPNGKTFVSGTGKDPTFDGQHLAARGDAVVVTINYRLSTLGFLALPDGKTNGNFGLADQIVALEWVQKNIENFGGDPSRVMIFGQSAGAGSARALLASQKARGLFAAAVPMSNLGGLNFGTTYSKYYTIEQDYELYGTKILNETNCSSTDSPLDCLRQVDALTLVSLPTVASYLVVDGTYLLSDELELRKGSPSNPVHVMMGLMRDDGAPFIAYPTTTNVTQALDVDNFPGQQIVASGLFTEPSGPNATLNVFNVTTRVTTDGEFRCIDQSTAYVASMNNIFLPDIYFYMFNRSYQIPNWSPNAPTCDAPITPEFPYGDPSQEYFKCHSGELMYVFGSLDRLSQPLRDNDDLPFMQFIIDTWASYARSYNPNPDPAFLQARGFTNSSNELEMAGQWQPINTGKVTMRQLQWPSFQTDFIELQQCNSLGFPLSYYMTN
ncbi:hypothetical protein BZG36_04204 [Bifiguratus adelaidae]|uniref:Carboxylic ester hydrolase n=1 Tax=Bifiguratus adelaidae TaxID=1938954 RepID=A0A261XY98_9FUNG|nr:hypothetical protein BZG36_04204 [Bifiguratus adelaidae]